MKKEFIKNNIHIFLSLVIGAVIFILIYGPDILNPTYIDWMFLTPAHDVPQHQIGWEFFRNTPWLFPFGIFNTLSYPVYTSVIDFDSIPIFAIIFKIFSDILPQNFQYLGLWGIICYMLQCLFGTIISKKFTNNKLLALLGGILFTLMPILSLRMYIHTALATHWLLLLCMMPIVYDKELSFKYKLYIYTVAGILTAGIQVYLIAICGIIVLVHTLYCVFANKQVKSMLFSILYSLSSIITLWLLGIFSMNTIAATDKESLFAYSANLNTLFNPSFVGRAYPELKIIEFPLESFGYLGCGILSLLFISLFLYFINKRKNINTIEKINKNFYIQCFILIGISMILACSPQITFNNKILFTVPYPDFIINIWSVLRSTGRFIFITDYVILTVIIAYLFKNTKVRTVVFLLIVSIVIQVYDLFDHYKGNYCKKSPDITYINAFNKDIYKNIFINVKVIYPVFDVLEYQLFIYDIAQYAYEHNMKLGNFYSSRDIEDYDERLEEKIKKPQDDELYIIPKDNIGEFFEKEQNLKYFYLTDNFIYAKTTPAEGLEEYTYDIKKER